MQAQVAYFNGFMGDGAYQQINRKAFDETTCDGYFTRLDLLPVVQGDYADRFTGPLSH